VQRLDFELPCARPGWWAKVLGIQGTLKSLLKSKVLKSSASADHFFSITYNLVNSEKENPWQSTRVSSFASLVCIQ
jgi:hypothetical protein